VIHVKGTPLSNSSVNRDVCLIAAALNRLVRLDLLEKNPVKRVRRGREPLRSRVVLSKEEIAHLLEACGPPLRLLAMAAFLTGQRPSELKAVRWGDVNLEDGTLSVFRKKVGLGGSIPLHPRLASELRDVKKRRFSERGGKIADDEHVFLSRAGTPYKDYRTSWLNALKRAGLDRRPGLTFYSLRHSFATHSLEKGSPADLQALMGHASYSTTERYVGAVAERAGRGWRRSSCGSSIGDRLAVRGAHRIVRRTGARMNSRGGQVARDDGPVAVGRDPLAERPRHLLRLASGRDLEPVPHERDRLSPGAFWRGGGGPLMDGPDAADARRDTRSVTGIRQNTPECRGAQLGRIPHAPPAHLATKATGRIRQRSRLGGSLNLYYREAG